MLQKIVRRILHGDHDSRRGRWAQSHAPVVTTSTSDVLLLYLEVTSRTHADSSGGRLAVRLLALMRFWPS